MWLILSSRKAGFISGLFVCPGLEDSWQPPIYLWWTSISLCKAGRQQEEQLTSSAGSGQGWAIVMNIMCKYERRETKGWFCYGNVVIGADWVLIWRVCVRVCVHTWTWMCMSSCMHAGNKTVFFFFSRLRSFLKKKRSASDQIRRARFDLNYIAWVDGLLYRFHPFWSKSPPVSGAGNKKTASNFLFNPGATAKQRRYQKLALTGFMKSFNLSFITIS